MHDPFLAGELVELAGGSHGAARGAGPGLAASAVIEMRPAAMSVIPSPGWLGR
ncbi:MAG TPA: hypothetical protein VFV41_25355 [Streptosporangiaceae bacterium]|nr:hypothetical protein [Streptosporangiaceae bacterium]